MRISVSVATAAAILAIAAAGASLSGCIVAAGGAVAGYGVLAEDLSPEQQIHDFGIKTQVQGAWGNFSPDMARRLDAAVFDGEVLITGRVASRRWRAEAVRLARRVAGVRRVFDEVEIGPDTFFIDSARDAWITGQLRGELVADLDVKSINYVITTSDGIVYLMGFARTQPELDRVIAQARTVAGVRRVTSFVRVLSAGDINGPLPGDEDTPPPPGPDEDEYGPPPDQPSYGPPPGAPSYAPEPDDAPPPDEPGYAPEPDDAPYAPQSEAPSAPPPDRGTIRAEPLGPQ